MNVEIALSELDLPFPESPDMNYHEAPVVRVGNKLVVGYLSPDDDCQDPLESSCGLGKIFTARRNDARESHESMQQALGLDRNWMPDLDLCNDFERPFRQLWIEAAADSEEFRAWADQLAGPEAQLTRDVYLALARKFWRKVGIEPQGYGVEDIWDFAFTDKVREALWRSLRNEGKIGDPDAVLLDCYDHGTQVWSLTGQGTQCQFDTAKGAGVWVPDDEARKEILRRSKVYAFGRLQSNGSWTLASGRKRYWAELDAEFGGERSEEFRAWHEAFDWLERRVKRLKKRATKALAMKGRQRATRELAADALAVYNDWLSGDCHGVVVCVYENTAHEPDEEPDWKLLHSDESWGYIGADATMAEVRESVRVEAERLRHPPVVITPPLYYHPHHL